MVYKKTIIVNIYITMSETIDKILYTSIFMYIFMMATIMIIKPEFMYNRKNQQYKQFGLDDGKTIFTVQIIGLIASVLIYMFVVIYHVILHHIEKS
jgi:hypothetical protein